jgi:hypothetical protein
MSLELVNTIAALSTTAVITATAVAALAQLRHLRAGNQIAGFLTLRTMLDDESHQQALALLQREGDLTRDEAFRAYAAAVFAGTAADHERFRALRAAVGMLGNSFEVMGTLVRNGVVDRRMFLEQYCGTINGMWRRLEHYIAMEREIQHDDGIWEDFEYLAALSAAFIAEHPSVYPHGVPRLLPSYADRATSPSGKSVS